MADFVADALTPGSLRHGLGWSDREVEAYLDQQRRGEQRALRMHETYVALDLVYQGQHSDETKLAAKKLLLEALQRELGFNRPINNATLAQSRTYHTAADIFEDVLRACDNDWPRFWEAMKTIDDDSFSGPQQSDLTPILAAAKQRCL
jgi:predicted aminopeptidase